MIEKYEIDKFITNNVAIKYFNVIVERLEEDENLNPITANIANKIAMLEQHIQLLNKDVEARGVVEWFVNGAQEMYRDNKSVDKIKTHTEQQRKLLAELKLTPASDKRKESTEKVEEYDDFDDF